MKLQRNPEVILPKVGPATGLVWAFPADVFATFFCCGVYPSSPGERKLHKCARPVERSDGKEVVYEVPAGIRLSVNHLDSTSFL